MPHDFDNPAIEAAGKNTITLSGSSIEGDEDGHGSFEAVGKQSIMQREIEQQREVVPTTTLTPGKQSASTKIDDEAAKLRHKLVGLLEKTPRETKRDHKSTNPAAVKKTPSKRCSRPASSTPKAQYMARGSNMLTLRDLMETDDDLRLWLEHTMYFDEEHRNKKLHGLRKLEAIDAERARVVSELQSSPNGMIIKAMPEQYNKMTSFKADSRLSNKESGGKRPGSPITFEPVYKATKRDNGGRHEEKDDRGFIGPRYLRDDSRDGRRRTLQDTVLSSSSRYQDAGRPYDPGFFEETNYGRLKPSGEVFSRDAAPRDPFDSSYFLIKSMNHISIAESQREGIWVSQNFNEEKLRRAFHGSRNVYLLFSVNQSGAFQGYARMTSAPRSDLKMPAWMAGTTMEHRMGDPFRVEWLNTDTTDYRGFAHITNPLNEGSLVFKGRDAQEVSAESGRRVVEVIKRAHGGS
ncbi:hypothetical protein S7711_09398 [Stachybotrys chartarum IBT 7711]|uniref:YTH domain-containing protein n=1 Tax=Stachybotrys chartarum (strain CBS 109288 / IBT 7711) TaxID=1280523 RepID=A0A084AKR2_STACB|nr:hypothetical protein S7711_09398 [Stachybotrys chartarum IBT 7711]KFA50931.1 hypothetical protein S40293_02460 [Stachybotrys chartarum IBT 40293]